MIFWLGAPTATGPRTSCVAATEVRIMSVWLRSTPGKSNSSVNAKIDIAAGRL
jgi:hypothetical protein